MAPDRERPIVIPEFWRARSVGSAPLLRRGFHGMFFRAKTLCKTHAVTAMAMAANAVTIKAAFMAPFMARESKSLFQLDQLAPETLISPFSLYVLDDNDSRKEQTAFSFCA